eukprot:SAG11_NODE_3891_length_2163_cov_1.973837_1_plen_146_part_00
MRGKGGTCHCVARGSSSGRHRQRSVMKRAKEAKAKAKQKLAEREAAKLLGWREQVMKEPHAELDVSFFNLEGWKEGLSAGNEGGKGALQKKAENAARLSVLRKIHEGITKKLMVPAHFRVILYIPSSRIRLSSCRRHHRRSALLS